MKNENLFELYLAMRSEHVEWISRHSHHFSHYLTLVVAVLAVTLGASYHFLETEGGRTAVIVAILGFGANVGLCCVAKRACDRYYRQFLESVTVMAKLEASLELEKRPSGAADPFEDDKYWFPVRFREDRRHKTAESFVKAGMNKGVNRTVMETMGILAIVNFVFLLVVGAVLLLPTWLMLLVLSLIHI